MNFRSRTCSRQNIGLEQSLTLLEQRTIPVSISLENENVIGTVNKSYLRMIEDIHFDTAADYLSFLY